MAQVTLPQIGGQPDETPVREEAYIPSLPLALRKILKPLASLKLTVGLFAASIFLIFAGTLVQTRMDVWYVMNLYFRNWFAWVEFKIFFPPAWVESVVAQNWQKFFLDFPGGFYFPGGFLIGSLMAVNLIAAHTVRFTIQAKGTRLWLGLGVIALGCLTTYGVIAGGATADGIQGVPVFSWATLWRMLKLGLACSSVAGAYLANNLGSERKLERRLLLIASILLGALVAWLLYEGPRVNLGDSSMRILWQLIQATLSGIVLLIGCIMVFKKRAGVVLLHAGVGLMMLSELLVTMSAKESQMFIREGNSVDQSIDARNPELALIDISKLDEDRVTTIPDEQLATGAKISDAGLPCDIEVVKYFKNARLRMLKEGEENPATQGRGLREGVKELTIANGVSTDSKFDRPAAYVKLLDKKNGEALGTWLVALRDPENAESVTIDGKPYQILIRFEHLYRDYKIKLLDFKAEYYPGSPTPKNFESDIEIKDPSIEGTRKARIWMNNPLRYRGLTYYQSSFTPADSQGREMTILQVVANHGWMIPYVSCMIVAVGLFYHFGLALLRFLKRGVWKFTVHKTQLNPSDWILPAVIVLVALAWVGSFARTPKPEVNGMDLGAFAMLPVVDEGRVKPMDTFARLAFRVVSTSEEVDVYKGDDNDNERDQKLTAIRWLLDVISGSEAGLNAPVIRIDHPDVLNMLGLERKKGLRYSIKQLESKMPDIIREDSRLDTTKSNEWTAYDRKIKELTKRIGEIRTLKLAFDLPFPIPTREELEKSRDAAIAKFSGMIDAIQAFPENLSKLQAPSVIPTFSKKDILTEQYHQWADWQPLSVQELVSKLQGLREKNAEVNPATELWLKLLAAYRANNAEEFNRSVAQLRRLLKNEPPPNLNFASTDFEVRFNRMMPFYHASVLYLIAFVFTILTWFGGPAARPLNRTAFALIAFTLMVHTWAIWARMAISGRPPVTNLYTTAIFIGWATVLFGLVFEGMYKIGVGNVLASVTGWATLLIAHGIAGDGDTFTVLQAVLDTQFWLATHVVTINLGYATTFVSGTLGILYVLRGLFTPSLTPEIGKSIARMIYGTLCFGMFFSFVGTVLGGLWGDDSWGRFWGWDPKENGALMIVLWTALVLHARWDGMVKDRGLAVLAIGGNIWTAWSWFGVNQLGVGLHSYGSTEGTLQKLGLFVLSQFIIIGLGMLPKSCWWSFCANKERQTISKLETRA
jgi:ABC-type transport system involved in cytochrome c biogenesis permease subunit